jgi:hypothetical protein
VSFCRTEGDMDRLLTHHSKCFTSFGGLLMALEGPYKKLTPLRVDYVYMLMKR